MTEPEQVGRIFVYAPYVDADRVGVGLGSDC